MSESKIKSILRVLGVGALVLGLSGSVLAQGPPGPPQKVPPWLADLLDRLDDIETKIDNQIRDLRGVTQNWDKKLTNSAERFTVLADFDNKAVRDNETGLVWEKSPTTTSNWFDAITHCAQLEVDDRKGWALPMREQLASLVDTTSQSCTNDNVCLPDGHPFLNVQAGVYWSATTSTRNGDVFSPALAWVVLFSNGDVFNNGKGGNAHAWCVRGGQSFDGNTHGTLH
jgi:hypothetical protein